jgi:peptide chain release factor 2
MADLGRRREWLAPWREFQQRIEDLVTLAELAEQEKDPAAAAEAERELPALQEQFERLETWALLAGEYDDHNAIISINAGAGGTEACDWVDMLVRMYLRWAERQGYESDLIDRTPGDLAGSKSVTAAITGPSAYGYLRAERGVHRLVRISPFDAQNRRHTTFASVDVIPEVEAADHVDVDSDDLRIETYRATGAGGQHVNKTDSAVRITHLPTGIVAQCQNERSQHKNRTNAMRVLMARLLERRHLEELEKMAKIRGEQPPIEWARQIRSYFLHPYKMVKDHRTDFETANAEAVLDGELDDLMRAFLRWDASNGKRTQ